MEVKGKYVIGFDTVCDGNQASTDENELPVLYDSHKEAMTELFSDAIAGLEGTDEDYLNENGITDKTIEKMKTLLASGDVDKMEAFLNKKPECNYYEDFVEKAEDFILGRKAIFTGQGIVIEGTKLEDL
jgi:hypothetical protein